MEQLVPPTTMPVPRRAQRFAVWFGVFGVPVVWLAHLVLSLTLVRLICASGVEQRDTPSWGTAQLTIEIASALAFPLAAGGAWAAWRVWKKTDSLASVRRGTWRFVSWCSVAVSGAFALALTFSICVLIAVPFDRLCGPFR